MRRILVVIDMQNDFISGSLGTREAQAVVDAVRRKLYSYPAADIYYTMDTHGEDYLNTLEGKNLPVPHCIRGTKGWDIHPEIQGLLAGAKRYEKPAFGSLRLAQDRQEVQVGACAPCPASPLRGEP